MSSCEIVLYKLNPCAVQRILYDRFDRAYGRLLVDTAKCKNFSSRKIGYVSGWVKAPIN